MGTTQTRNAGMLVTEEALGNWRPTPFFRNGLFTEIERVGRHWILAIRGQNPPATVLLMANPTPEEYETGQRVVEEAG